MMDFEDFIYIGFLSAVDLSAVLANSLLISIIIRKTPRDLSNYGVLLFNISCVDLFSSFCSFMCLVRLQTFSGCTVFLFEGPCTLFSAKICHFFFSGHSAFSTEGVIFLLLSFSYRLWVLKPIKHDLRTISRRLWFASAAVLLFGISNMSVSFLAAQFSIPFYSSNLTISAFDISGGIADNFLPRFFIFSNIVACSIGFGSIFIIRRRLFLAIKNRKNADRHSHQLIYRTLTLQMLLPIAYLIAVSLWLLDVFEIVQSRTLQRSIFTSTSFFTLASPLINMYYIPPYKRYLKSLFFNDVMVVPKTSSSDATHQQDSRH